MTRRNVSALKICHFNAQSIRNKIDELQHYMATAHIDVCAINETWLSKDDKLNVPGYTTSRRDRNSTGGGVCFLVHNSLKFNVILPAQNEEILAIKVHDITTNRQDICIVTYYSAPKTSINLEPLYDLINDNNNTLIIGDLNAHSEAWHSRRTCPKGQLLTNFIIDANLYLINSEQPTYRPLHRPHYSSTLDLAFCTPSITHMITDFQVTDEIRSDHLAVVITLKTRLMLSSSAAHETKSFNWPLFTAETNSIFSSLVLPQLETTKDIDETVKNITEAI